MLIAYSHIFRKLFVWTRQRAPDESSLEGILCTPTVARLQDQQTTWRTDHCHVGTTASQYTPTYHDHVPMNHYRLFIQDTSQGAGWCTYFWKSPSDHPPFTNLGIIHRHSPDCCICARYFSTVPFTRVDIPIPPYHACRCNIHLELLLWRPVYTTIRALSPIINGQHHSPASDVKYSCGSRRTIGLRERHSRIV